MKGTLTEAGIIAGYSCPNCQKELPDFAVSCKDCGTDVRFVELRSQPVLDKSINRKDQSIFFYVSPLKLLVMSTATFGIYELFWFYKNWTYIDEHTNRLFSPTINAIFGFVTVSGLMKDMMKAAEEAGQTIKLTPWLWGVLYFLLSLGSRAVPVVPRLLACMCLLPAQKLVNSLNQGSPTPINDKFSIFNWVTIVIGFGLQAFTIYSFFFM